MSWDVIGTGAVASVGGSVPEIFAALCAGARGLAAPRAFDPGRYRARVAYEIDDRRVPGRDEPGRATRWLKAAVAQALAEAGLDGASGGRHPVLVGTTLREQRTAELWWTGEAPLRPEDLHFGTALDGEPGVGAAHTFANACAASLCALALGTDLIDLDEADTVVVAGTDSIAESVFGTLDRVQNAVPTALRPFDAARRGMVPGEGAAAVVLARAGLYPGRARARLLGVATNCDARHPTAPTPGSIAAAIRDAHRRAGVRPEDVDLVMLHGTGTPLNDVSEARALTEVFGAPDARPLMTAIKGATGHTLGGSGLLSLIMATRALAEGTVPPIAGLADPIPEAAGLGLVTGSAARAPLATAQVDAFGFGGINAVAVLEAEAAA
ncbi:beta-ketoacyl synthase N-terminal-like domain-containing protein [Actinomadura fibrosa]|uniref:Beta-ketoacyl synthase N-terminal-like domain-containing protein n=1 Tax=Actinomadura fibrosa TaxID=111802 RepID=A0ABW2Y0B2_9ACTN